MNIYSLLKINRFVKSTTIRTIGIWLLHILNKRYIVTFFDPVLGCNLRCRMCYFSNEEKRKIQTGRFALEDLERIAEVILPQTLKLQIGCGYEPSLFKHNAEIIRLGKQYRVPYISFTTNANLLSSDEIEDWLKIGLNEFTVSLHGIEKTTYEFLMQGASYDKFMLALQTISMAKSRYPHFKLRINYTTNEQNIDELAHFFDVFGEIKLDVLQVRPIQDLSGEIRGIENVNAFNAQFNRISLALNAECSKRGIIYIAPLHLDEISKTNYSSSIVESMYCYISPRSFWLDIDWRNETFKQYSRRTHYAFRLFANIFRKKNYQSEKLNYEIN